MISSRANVKPAKRAQGNVIRYVLLLFSCVAIFGILFSASMVPNNLLNGPSTNSLLYNRPANTLSQRLLEWLPKHHLESAEMKPNFPDWDVEFWTPIDVEVSSDSMVILCKLNFRKYWENPHSYPMFKDLEGLSHCMGKNRKRERISTLIKEMEDSKGTDSAAVVKPTGFVFHESRVGSTLIANFLASDPWSLVFSESTPMANAILHCQSCSKMQQIQLLRDVATLMGRSPVHKRLFFKFQSITATKMEIVLEVCHAERDLRFVQHANSNFHIRRFQIHHGRLCSGSQFRP